MKLYPHQEKAVAELHNGAILWGDVGTGKSMVAVEYYMRNEAPKDVIVITTAKKRDSLDWQREFARRGVGGDPNCSVAGSLTVDSWNNIGTYRHRTGCFFVFDEQRVVGSGKWTKDFIKIASHNQWILLSATPGDTWLDYIPVFLANGFYKNRTEFLQEHVVFKPFSKYPKVQRYIGVNRLVKYRNNLLVEMPLDRHTTRKTEIVPVDYDEALFERVLKKRWHVYENRPLRDVAELFTVLRKVVNSDASRREAVRTLLRTHPKMIVFYSFDYELESLRKVLGELTQTPANIESHNQSSSTRPSMTTSSSVSAAIRHSTSSSSTSTDGRTKSTTTSGDDSQTQKSTTNAGSLPQDSGGSSTKSIAPIPAKSSFTLAEWNGHKHEPIPTTDRWVYLVQYSAGSEGWNCIETNAMVFYSLTYSYKMWHQAHGRIDRLNTPFKDLHYYVLMSKSMIDQAVWKSLMSKKNFNESRFLSKVLDTHSQKSP